MVVDCRTTFVGAPRKHAESARLDLDIHLDHSRLSLLAIMNGLLAEIATKRKSLAVDNSDERPSKYMRRGEIERLKEEKERKAKEQQASQDRAAKEAAQAKAAAEKAAKVCSRYLRSTANVY